MIRRLLEPSSPPPFAARIALFGVALAALGGTYAATGSLALQTLVAFAAALAYPAAAHVLGSDESDGLVAIARLRNPRLRVLFPPPWRGGLEHAAPAARRGRGRRGP
jgi:hypothetical protein